jgi:hypothetical protein
MKRRALVTESSADPVFEDIPPAQMWMFSSEVSACHSKLLKFPGLHLALCLLSNLTVERLRPPLFAVFEVQGHEFGTLTRYPDKGGNA